MGLTKTEDFTLEQNELAAMAKALGHPARIAILQYLIQRKSCMCGDIVEELPLSQSTVSQHLLELKKAGLIQGSIDGPRVCYCIEPKAWQRIKEHLTGLLESFTDTSCC